MRLQHSEYAEALHTVTPQAGQSLTSPPPGHRRGPSTSPGTSHGGTCWPEERRLFIGREREMEALQAVFAHALAGSGRLILVAGEPGIGKTHLLETFARVAGQH